MPDFVIVGCPRSGTTLIQRLVAEVGDVHIGPETHLLRWLVRRPQLIQCDASALLRQFAADTSNAEIASLPIDAARTRLERGRDTSVNRIPPVFEAWTALLAETTPHRGGLLGEKTPEHFYWWRPLVEAGVRVVWLVRDPRDVCLSRKPLGWGTYSPTAIGAQWGFAVDQLAEACGQAGERVLTVPYESAVLEPEVWRERLADFIGADSGSRNAATNLFDPGVSRWKRRALGPIDPSRANRWRHELSGQEVAEVEAAIGRQRLERHGYRSASAPHHRLRAAGSLSLARRRRHLRDRHTTSAYVADEFAAVV